MQRVDPVHGETQEIQPHAVLDATTEPATDITPNTAVLNAAMDPDGMETTYHFEYGLDTDYNVKSESLDAGAGTGVQSVPGIEVEKLQPGTLYHYRVVAVNELGATHGQDRTFVSGASPRISSVRTRNLTETSVDILANINPIGSATQYHVE